MDILTSWLDFDHICPSQSFLIVLKDGTLFNLYLRWREFDPWEGYVLVTEENLCRISEELFSISNFNFSYPEISGAKDKLIELAELWINEYLKKKRCFGGKTK